MPFSRRGGFYALPLVGNCDRDVTNSCVMQFRAALTQENRPRFAPCGAALGRYEVPIESFTLFTIRRWGLICRVEKEGITGQASPRTYPLTVHDAEPYGDLATTVTVAACSLVPRRAPAPRHSDDWRIARPGRSDGLRRLAADAGQSRIQRPVQ